MAYRARLDHDQVFWGVDEIAQADAKEGDVLFDHVPDNAPGAYRWDAKLARFEPLPASQIKAIPGAPSIEQAFHDFIHASDITLPPRTAAWRDAFKKTVDGSGA